jgi:mRNA interferase MazF
MAITFHPNRGTILMCDFSGFREPEMVKTRPVVVLSGKGVGLITIVPLSTVQPEPLEKWHHEMNPKSLPENLRDRTCWAKCDMIATLSAERMDLIRTGRGPDGRRTYYSARISAADLAAIELCVIEHLHMKHLTQPKEKPIL